MGRHKEFCVETALARALEVFWRHGYEGASLAELTAAMGVTRPSLYSTYGNKETLFRTALDLYEKHYLGFTRAALELATAREVVTTLLAGFVDVATGADSPPGCMGTQGALACSTAAEPIKAELFRRRAIFETELAERLARALQEGDIPADESPADLARFVMVVAGGLAVQAAGGASRTSLKRAATLAMRAWPTATRAAELALTDAC